MGAKRTSRAWGNLLVQINRISGTQEMGWQRICLLESELPPFIPAAGVSLINFQDGSFAFFEFSWFSLAAAVLSWDLGEPDSSFGFPQPASVVLDKSFISLCFSSPP